MSQTQQILQALKSGDKITQMDALQRFGCFRLGARILEIRQMGHSVSSRMVDAGNGKRVAEYSM